MKKQVYYILWLAILQAIPSFGQFDSINFLEEVVLSDVHLKKSSRGQQVRVLKDSVIEENAPSLTSILRFNTPLYFKENGPGMVSSVSFRGTTASQTAVIWNGININSQFTGQTDFNTLITSNYDNIAVRSGGGSVLYGSGAIGGSVHLNNRFRFDQGFNNRLRLTYGSFDTFFGSYTAKYSSEGLALQLNVSHHRSDNDFKYFDTEKVNSNGDFENSAMSAAAAYVLDDWNTLRFYTYYFSGERGFSGTLYAPSKSKYGDKSSRNMLEWINRKGDFNSSFKVAFLDEAYRYFENRYRAEYTFGRARSGILKYDLEYEFQPQMSLSGIVDLNYTEGKGTGIGDKERRSGSLGLLFSHDLERMGYELSLRKEITDHFNSPLLFSVGAGFQATDHYSLRLSVSRNYRIPTFNDLFWEAGGNADLEPEKSLQAEVGQKLHFRQVDFDFTAFIIRVEDMLRWVPDSGGQWRPVNTQSVRNFGIEFLAGWEKNLGDHQLHVTGTYAWTRSEDLNLKKFLIYVPEHKTTAAIAYAFGNLSLYYQHLYTGSVYTSSDNNYTVDSYNVSNLGLEYSFLKDETLSVGVEVSNLWNEKYQIMPSRPMPGPSLNSTLILNF